MRRRFYSGGELKDENICVALRAAADQYENGEIAEVKDVLMEIIAAIEEFEANYKL